jgi:hypothetical protein
MVVASSWLGPLAGKTVAGAAAEETSAGGSSLMNSKTSEALAWARGAVALETSAQGPREAASAGGPKMLKGSDGV